MRETFDVLTRRFGNPAWNTTLPEAAKRLFINAVFMAVIECFPADLIVSVEHLLQGSLGRGPVDYLLKYRNYNIIVTEAKKDDIDGGIAQNVAQLKAASEVSAIKLMISFNFIQDNIRYKRKRDAEIYGIVTDSVHWVFLKLNGVGNVFFRSEELFLSFNGEKCIPSSIEIFQWVHAIISIQIRAVDEQEAELDASKKAKLGE
jgi:hypothetical protein